MYSSVNVLKSGDKMPKKLTSGHNSIGNPVGGNLLTAGNKFLDNMKYCQSLLSNKSQCKCILAQTKKENSNLSLLKSPLEILEWNF